jgi:hypothetical protein
LILNIFYSVGINDTNVDLLGITGPSTDLYLQRMNHSLHKKFRRQNHIENQYTSLHPASADHSHINNNNNELYHPTQTNGDYKNTKPTVGNGQALSEGNGGGDDDDDDIVLVSDDDDSEDKNPATKINSMYYSKRCLI